MIAHSSSLWMAASAADQGQCSCLYSCSLAGELSMNSLLPTDTKVLKYLVHAEVVVRCQA